MVIKGHTKTKQIRLNQLILCSAKYLLTSPGNIKSPDLFPTTKERINVDAQKYLKRKNLHFTKENSKKKQDAKSGKIALKSLYFIKVKKNFTNGKINLKTLFLDIRFYFQKFFLSKNGFC